jgi:hypothetical protein
MSDVQTKEPATEIEVPPTPPANLPAVPEPQRKVTVIPQSEKPTVLPQTKVAKIAAAISSVMAEVGVIAKDGTNRFHNYKFVQMQDVLQRLTPLLAKHGIMIMQTEVGRAMFDEDRAVSVQYQFTIAHSSGEVWPERPLQTGLSRCRDNKGGFDDKSLNKCHTAARKYFLMSLFQIPTGDQDDADLGQNDGPRRPARPAPNVMVDPETGEITDWSRGAKGSPEPVPADQPAPPAHPTGATPAGAGKVAPGDAGQAPAPVTALDKPAGAGADLTSDDLEAWDITLKGAAERGMAELGKAWASVPGKVQQTLKVALERRHKPRAMEVDAAAP